MSMSWVLALTYNAVLLSVGGYAWVRGGRPERIGAAINIAASFATGALQLIDRRHYAPAEAIVLGIDVVVAISFYWLAIRTTRFWPIWAFGFALANLIMTVAALLLPGVSLFAYHSGLSAYAYLALGALLLGAWRMPPGADDVLKNGSRRAWFAKEKLREHSQLNSNV
ncbi:hypothetical protein [Sphingobium lactosutens]|uniref:Uncharacterized protein n=1 Tax=Sphingobium lactosutens DS20 TaxID=1331060 RepID=T0H4Z3_9SPHN|nr:hypothetical protein [Sphingobium lactosutens]EQB11386.1 hypothetical protein RLDS_23575 [Sphingobium lactosutens DS20]